jgi:hypothetical protein
MKAVMETNQEQMMGRMKAEMETNQEQMMGRMMTRPDAKI